MKQSAMSSKKTIKALIIVLCFLFSCTVKTSHKKAEHNNNQITLVFKNPPPNWEIHLESGGYTSARTEINYINDNFIPIQFFPNSEHEFDTLIIKTKRKVFEIRHSYKGIDELSYIFQNGDTVLFTYKDKTPTASVLNRETKTYDVNFELFTKKTFYPEDYSSYIKYRKPMMFMKPSKNIQQEEDRVVKLANNNLTSEINKEKTLLDSLYKHDLISNESYQLFNTQFIYQRKIIELFTLIRGSHPAKRLIPGLTKENFNIQLGYDIEMGLIEGGNILDSKNDSLL